MKLGIRIEGLGNASAARLERLARARAARAQRRALDEATLAALFDDGRAPARKPEESE